MLGPTALGLALLAAWAAPASADHPIEGTLQGVHADYFDLDTSVTQWQVDTGETTVPVLPTTLPALTPESAAVAVDDQTPGPGVVGPVTASQPQAVPSAGGRKTAVIAFNFASNPVEPWTPADIQGRVFTNSNSTSAFFREESYDQLWLTDKDGDPEGKVYGWYTLDTPNDVCAYGTWAGLADEEAKKEGFNSADYQHVMYVFPPQAKCGWAGLAYMPGTQSWINGDLAVRVTAHELGHNLGLHHAGSWSCTGFGDRPVTISSNCDLSEYNDPFDVMGGHTIARHSHGRHLERLGVLQESNVQTVGASGTYTVTSALAPTSQPTTLRIPRTYANGAAEDWYYLEVRQPGGVFDGFSPNDWVVNGVSIRIAKGAEASRLLDTHPTTNIFDAALRPGEAFNDGQISVRTVSAGSGSATVEIQMAAGPLDQQAPLAPSGLSGEISNGDVRLFWTVSGDNVGVNSYPLYRDGVQIGSAASNSYDDTTVLAGKHVYTVYAQDAAGNRSPASALYTVTVPAAKVKGLKIGSTDRSGPRVRLVRRRVRGHRLLLSVSARDRAGVARVELRIDGRRVSARRARKLSYRWRVRPGRHRVVVVAHDKRGNRAVSEYRLRVRA